MPNTPAPAEVLSRLLEAVPGGVVYVSAEGGILQANSEAISFLGLSYDALAERFTQDFEGDTWFEDGTPCSAAEYPVTQALTQGTPAGPTTIGVTQPEGPVRWAVFRAIPVEGGGAVVTFLDITERRKAESRLRMSDRLASLGRLAAGVAHEINNPLTWVLLHLERALDEPEPREAIQTAIDGIDRVTKIVADLGAFSRATDDRPTPFDLRQAVDQAIAIARPEIRHRATVAVEFDDLPHVVGVASRAVQIFLNLILNAAHAIEPGDRESNRITITASVRDTRVRVEVRDTGAGMGAETLDRALEPFFTTKASNEGTGLGLAISHALTLAMGGTLEMESEPGIGTCVILHFPMTELSVSPASPSPAPTPAKRTAKILVVDDEPQIAEMVAWALEPHTVVCAHSGRDALRHLETGSFDAVVCDLMMPDVTGMSLHAALAASQPQLLSRLIFVTGGAYTPEAQAFLERTDIRCLKKPFRAVELVAAVNAVLDS